MITDRELVDGLRRAVSAEAARAPQAGLADRLLAGAGRRRRGRAVLVGVAAAAVVASSAAVVAETPWRGQDRLGLDTAGLADIGQVMPVSEARVVTREMAARQGLDGTPQCRSDAVQNPERFVVPPGLELYGAFLTDQQGFARWGTEFGTSLGRGGPPPEPALIALCWFTGPIGPDGSGMPGRPPATHQLVAVQLDGSAGTQGVPLSVMSSRPLPVLVPPLPALPAQDPLLSQGLRAAVQPAGVTVVDELPRYPAVDSYKPAVDDCTPTGCTDPDQETIVGVQVLFDGEPLDPRGTRRLTPGRPVEISLALDVEPGQTIQDIYLGVSSTGPGGYAGEPLGLDAVLLRQPTATGKQTYRTTWTVPDDLKASQLVVYYEMDKYQPGASHGRTVGGVAL